MAQLFRLSLLERYTLDDFQRAIAETRRTLQLRDAAAFVIEAVHGLPDLMETDLTRLQVYVGRTGASPNHVRGRWIARFAAFENAPSTHALIAALTTTTRLREQRWERTAQRIINSLVEHKALCCSNALLGDSGSWPAEENSIIYVVARLRCGRPSNAVNVGALHSAVADLVKASDLKNDVVREVGRAILAPERGATHVHATPLDKYEEDAEEGSFDTPTCKVCWRPARPGNYNFCGMHRAIVPSGCAECRVCGRVAIPGNYGFCGYHRR